MVGSWRLACFFALFRASWAQDRLAAANAVVCGRVSRRVVGRIAGASDRRRFGVEAEVGEDGHDRVALEDVGDDVAASAAWASEDVVEVDSSQQGGPVDARASRGHDCRAEARPRSARGRGRLVARRRRRSDGRRRQGARLLLRLLARGRRVGESSEYLASVGRSRRRGWRVRFGGVPALRRSESSQGVSSASKPRSSRRCSRDTPSCSA